MSQDFVNHLQTLKHKFLLVNVQKFNFYLKLNRHNLPCKWYVGKHPLFLEQLWEKCRLLNIKVDVTLSNSCGLKG